MSNLSKQHESRVSSRLNRVTNRGRRNGSFSDRQCVLGMAEKGPGADSQVLAAGIVNCPANNTVPEISLSPEVPSGRRPLGRIDIQDSQVG